MALRVMGSLCLLLGLAVNGAAQTTNANGQKLSVRYVDAPFVPEQAHEPYVPLTPDHRLQWWASSTFGLQSLLIPAPITAGYGTAVNRPHEYGPHWDGFADRYGARMLQVTVNNGIEAGLGAAWGEDPRYFRTLHKPFKDRVLNVIDLTFRAYGSDGQRQVAYARLTGDVGGAFLANTWLPPSISDWQGAVVRSLVGIGSRAAGNATREFLPDVLNWLRHKH